MSTLTLTPEELQAWDRYAAGAAALLADPDVDGTPERLARKIAAFADALIEERRKRQAAAAFAWRNGGGAWFGTTPSRAVDLVAEPDGSSWKWTVVTAEKYLDTGTAPDLDDAKRRAEHAYHAHAGEK